MAQTTVNFNLKNAGFSSFASQTLTFNLLTAGADKTDDSVILPGTVTATSGSDGTGSVALFRNGDSDIDSVYEVIFPNRQRSKFIIPAGSSSIHLSDLMVDHAPNGAATQQSSVYAAAIQRANHTGTQALSTISDASTVQLKPSEGAFANGDKTKLNSIETGATTDQTAAEIRTLVESATDSNVFTDADHTKLNGIEASATTDQTASEIRALVESATDSNVFTDADHTKLNGLDANAKAQVNFVPRSISFTNTSAYLSLADNANLDVGTGSFSFVFYAKLNETSTEPILTKLSGTGYRLRFVSGSLILTMQDSGGSADFTLATSLNDRKWHTYVVSIARSGNATAYVDNVAQTPVNVSGTAGNLDNSGEFRIGSDGGSNAANEVALGNYLILIKQEMDATEAGYVYVDPNGIKFTDDPQLMVDLRRADRTFTDVSNNALAVTTNGTIIYNQERITSLDNVIINPTLPAAITGSSITASNSVASPTITATLGIGYGGSGTGGVVTQGTSKSTTVVLNKSTGQITLHGAALAANTNVAFTLTNSTIAANDILVFNHVSGGTIGAYNFNALAGSSTATVTVRNITGGSLSEAPVVSFAVIKAVIA